MLTILQRLLNLFAHFYKKFTFKYIFSLKYMCQLKARGFGGNIFKLILNHSGDI